MHAFTLFQARLEFPHISLIQRPGSATVPTNLTQPHPDTASRSAKTRTTHSTDIWSTGKRTAKRLNSYTGNESRQLLSSSAFGVIQGNGRCRSMYGFVRTRSQVV